MKKIKFLVLTIIVVSFIGCAAPINQYNAINYANSAHNYSNSGDWDMARRHWARAAHNSELGGMDKDVQAVYYYELGRASGVTCFYDKAEEYLNKAYELDSKVGGPVHMSLVELFRLNLDQEKYNEAVSYFRRALPELEKIYSEREAPSEFLKLLEEYSVALDGNGNTQEAEEIRVRAEEVRKVAIKSITDRTPYGQYCSNN